MGDDFVVSDLTSLVVAAVTDVILQTDFGWLSGGTRSSAFAAVVSLNGLDCTLNSEDVFLLCSVRENKLENMMN